MARNRKKLGDLRNIFVKRSIKTRNLGNLRKRLNEGINQRDFTRQMIEIERLHAAEFGDDFRGNELIVDQMCAAFDDTVPDRNDRGPFDPLAQISKTP